MSGKVLISASELSDLLRTESAALIDTRDPAVCAEAHIAGAVDMREVFTYLATSTPEGRKDPQKNVRRRLRQSRAQWQRNGRDL